jgi:hypothetical protein
MIMNKRNRLPMVSFILFTMIYFTASIVLMGSQYRPLSMELISIRYGLILVGFSCLVLVYLMKNGLTIFRFPSFLSIYLFIIWILFSLSVVVSEVIKNTFPVQGFFFLFAVPFIYFTVMPYITKVGGPVIHQALFAANTLYILISFLTKPIEFLPYHGIAANPNGFGQLGAIAVISGFFILITLTKKRILTKMLVIAGILLSLVAVILSSSRTSFVIVGIITIVITAYFTMANRNFKPLITLAIVGVIGWLSPLRDIFLSGLVEKFTHFYADGNLLNDRTIIWDGVFREASLFGHGDNYFQNFIESAHNSLIYILGVYGIVPALLLSTFLLLLIVISFLYIFQSKNGKMAIFPFAMVITFILFSMTESMFGLIGSGITIAFYHVVGILIFNEGMTKKFENVYLLSSQS